MKGKFRVCELCDREATLYCGSDAAFLCFDCDSNVHNANFLVARHVRRLICRCCMSPTGNAFSGTRSPSLRQLIACRFCSSLDGSGEGSDEISCSSSSSSTLSFARMSSTESEPPAPKTSSCRSASEVAGGKKNIPARLSDKNAKKSKIKRSGAQPLLPEAKIEEIFSNWCKKLRLNGNLVVWRAAHAVALCSERLGRMLPLRVSLAASFWFGVRLCGAKSVSTWQNLRRLEEISGVPAKLIAAVELKLEHVLRVGRRRAPQHELHDMKEGWAES